MPGEGSKAGGRIPSRGKGGWSGMGKDEQRIVLVRINAVKMGENVCKKTVGFPDKGMGGLVGDTL